VTTHVGFAEMSTASSPTFEAPLGGGAPSTVTVVVCAYTQRRWPVTTQAIGSVLAQRTPPAEVILVIDHEPRLLRRATVAFPEVTVVANDGPQGLSGARNTGLALAHGEIIAFLDDDAEAEPEWITRLSAHYRDPAVLGVGGPAVPVWEKSRPRWLPPEYDWVVGCSYTGQPRRLSPVRNLIGCNMSFRRDALRRAGGFDCALGRVGKVPVGCEETELCIRLRSQRAGAAILYDPAAVVRHRVSAERATWSYFRRRCFSEGRSKAVVARLAGTDAALSSERAYVRRTLPEAIWREVSVSRLGDRAGLLRAAVIAAGLAITGTGYALARTRRVSVAAGDGAPHRVEGRHEPVAVLAAELADGVPAVPDKHPLHAGRYGAAQVLVCLHGQPLGLLRYDLPPGGLTVADHADLIAEQLAGEIEEHLRQDGVRRAYRLESGGRLSATVACAARARSKRTPFVSVVVPTCGREAVLRRCLHSIEEVDYPNCEIIVVDNRPERSETARLVREWSIVDSRMRYVSEPRRGVTHARNRGLAEASGEVVAFADDDVIIDRGWLRALVDGFTDEGVAAVTGFVLAKELETPAQLLIEEYGGFGKGCRRRRFEATGYETVENGQARRVSGSGHSLYPYLPGTYGSGANMAFRADVLRRLGGFDRVLGSPAGVPTGEDIDALMRLVLAGHAVVYQPSAIVWHTHVRDLTALRRTMYSYGLGTGAVMGKCLMTDGTRRGELVRRLPRGVTYALSRRSPKNDHKQAAYPISLTAMEICGMALGPAYYVRAVLTNRSEGSGFS
jgi:O-antigen biosynthesis protein